MMGLPEKPRPPIQEQGPKTPEQTKQELIDLLERFGIHELEKYSHEVIVLNYLDRDKKIASGNLLALLQAMTSFVDSEELKTVDPEFWQLVYDERRGLRELLEEQSAKLKNVTGKE